MIMVLSTALLALWLAQSPASNPAVSTRQIGSAEEATAILKAAGGFSTGLVGIGGDTPLELYAFGYLLKRADAGRIFLALLAEPGLSTKLYALCGLYLVDKKKLLAILPEYENIQGEVTLHSGCAGMSFEFSSLVKSSLPDGEGLDVFGGRLPIELRQGPLRCGLCNRLFGTAGGWKTTCTKCRWSYIRTARTPWPGGR